MIAGLSSPSGIITATAPVRICDNGGWTDTWFAGTGCVLNIAVAPRVQVRLAFFERGDGPPVVIDAGNFGDRYAPTLSPGHWERHPLLEAAFVLAGVPEGAAVEASIFSEMPAGASTGTSAAVCVALLGVLYRLQGRSLTPAELAAQAHRVETELLGWQSGIQDQLAAAYGGINFIEMPAYPQAIVTPVSVSAATWRALDEGLLLIYLGRSHVSSQVHQMVIRGLEAAAEPSPALEPLRQAAWAGKEALERGEMPAFGRALIANTEAQRALHPALISPEAQAIIDLAQAHNALGWKVNGAGGSGGSLTLFFGDSYAKQLLEKTLLAAHPSCRSIAIRLSREGLMVKEGSKFAG